MEKIKLSKGLEISRLVHGHWRIVDWKISKKELLKLTEQVIELGITTFDNADIYGNYSCEELFGNTLILKKELRANIQIITKCGIKIISTKFPLRKIPYYDYSYEHIIFSVETSLKKLNTDYIDLLLLHRPAPFFNPEDVAQAFSELKSSGKVLHFGTSNFDPMQFEMLNTYTDEKLITNQLEISPFCLEHFENGNMDFLLREKIKPMAWSPLAGGAFTNPQSEKELRVVHALNEVAEELNVENIDKIIYSWLLKHPASIIPIIGSGKIERVKNAIETFDIELNLEQWYKIYIASKGEPLP
jgi:predicted oxidoreductase